MHVGMRSCIPCRRCTHPPLVRPRPAGEPYGFGLEVGSKAELVMVMSQLAGRPAGTNLVCNGYKDSEYMELVSRRGPRRGARLYAAERGGCQRTAGSATLGVPSSAEHAVCGLVLSRAKRGTPVCPRRCCTAAS